MNLSVSEEGVAPPPLPAASAGQKDSTPRREPVTHIVVVPIRDQTGQAVGRAVFHVQPGAQVPSAWIVDTEGRVIAPDPVPVMI